MTAEKLKQYIALFGGLLSAILLFLHTLGVEMKWYTDESIDALTKVLIATVPFALVIYGIWKNTYVVSKTAKIQEKELEKKGLK
ncbi:phage holin [Rummeliibacillus sp. BSL5]